MKKFLKKLIKILKWIGIVLLGIIIIALIVRFIGQRINNKTPDGGINETMYVDINGTKQWINIYGQDKDNPVLLFLHGGPGAAISHTAYALTRKWSDVYTVVTWDQRNAGKSYSADQNSTELTYDLMMQDGVEMTEFLRKYLGKEKITLLGHSWGSFYGSNLVLAHPEYYDCYIGAAQVVDMDLNEQAFAQAATKWVGNDTEGKELLAKLDDPDEHDFAKLMLMKKYGYRGDQDKHDYNEIGAMFFNPYYSLSDYVKSLRIDFSVYERFITSGECDKFSLVGRTDYGVPYYNINGGCDYQVSFEVAQEYFDEVNAPRKKLYLMEDTRHLVIGKTEQFSEILHEIEKTERQYSNE